MQLTRKRYVAEEEIPWWDAVDHETYMPCINPPCKTIALWNGDTLKKHPHNPNGLTLVQRDINY